MGPAVADGLIDEFGGDAEGAGCAVGGEVVVRGAGAGGEVGVGGGFAVDGDVGRSGGFVEAGGEDAVVLEVLRGGEQAGGDVALAVAEDRLEDLDLIGLSNAGVVRGKARGVGVVGVAGDGAVGVELAGLENDMAVGGRDNDVEPCAARGVGRGQLVAGEILNADGEGKNAAGRSCRAELSGPIVTRADCDCRNDVMRAEAAAMSEGCAVTARSSRCAASMPSRRKLAPTKVCWRTPSRGLPRSDATATGSPTAGMWHCWQVCLSR